MPKVRRDGSKKSTNISVLFTNLRPYARLKNNLKLLSGEHLLQLQGDAPALPRGLAAVRHERKRVDGLACK